MKSVSLKNGHMFTVEGIELAHSRIKSGTDFPKYINDIKQMGVVAFETWVSDNHTVYYGKENFKTQSKSKYETLPIEKNVDREKFAECLKNHQQGETDYYTFCKHCSETGIERWYVDLAGMTCTYYDFAGSEILTENIPAS